MDIGYHLKYLKALIKGAPKKKGSKKETPTVTPGRWNSNGESLSYLVGIDTDGVYRLTWRLKDGPEIDKLQSMFNFSYIAALNPVTMLEVIEEFERLTAVEQELINLKIKIDNTLIRRLIKFLNKFFNKMRL